MVSSSQYSQLQYSGSKYEVKKFCLWLKSTEKRLTFKKNTSYYFKFENSKLLISIVFGTGPHNELYLKVTLLT